MSNLEGGLRFGKISLRDRALLGNDFGGFQGKVMLFDIRLQVTIYGTHPRS